KPLGVWDSQDTKLRGHATGHYLTAIAQACASTGYDKTLQAKFAQKMECMVNTLYTLSHVSGKPIEQGAKYGSDPTAVPPGEGKAHYDSDLSENGIRTDYWNWGVGFLSAYPPAQFIMLENGATYGGQNNQVWPPYYTLHKILAGLIDIYEVSGNQKALDIAIGMSDWVHARLNQLPEEKLIKIWNTYIAGEFGGMNETMAHMYRITSNQSILTPQNYLIISICFSVMPTGHMGWRKMWIPFEDYTLINTYRKSWGALPCTTRQTCPNTIKSRITFGIRRFKTICTVLEALREPEIRQMRSVSPASQPHYTKMDFLPAGKTRHVRLTIC